MTDRNNWQAAVARTVEAMGYDAIDVERSAGGLLRVTIDRVPGHSYLTGESVSVTIEDCEAVTHQLQYALEVDHIAYERLEVSSPGLDRPLRKEADIARFLGEAAEVTLKAPLSGRRKFRGRLAARDGGWRLVLDDELGRRRDTRVHPRKPAQAKACAPAPAPKATAAAKAPVLEASVAAIGADGSNAAASADSVTTLDFEWHEVREARLVPVLDFKGRAVARDEPEPAGDLQR